MGFCKWFRENSDFIDIANIQFCNEKDFILNYAPKVK